ncbi:alpha-amylase [Aliikangiella coralliicola]|uniref:Alpha-amylase n=2 Tax=Aliikangiella coralliicola TaxID=2592383 RepID=A0A545UK77_9GAMM|nr:alpha-amylase [Aliikangiella coralliicola]
MAVFTASFISGCVQSERANIKNTQKVEADTKAALNSNVKEPTKKAAKKPEKKVIYQVFTRLFGNRNTTNKPWGSIEENGVGKFNDFTVDALKAIKQFGTTHVWYTGVPHHALIRDYTQLGIANDDPDVVKGRAGSPYAVKDYYNVNPDLAVEPDNRLQEFKALVERTHQQGMKVIIDIVPNHVARNYQSISKPKGVKDFGAEDNTNVEYHRDNNFYYIVDQPFVVPEPLDGYQALGGEKHLLSDGRFHESPAKWTGNGARKAQPGFHDWYETVKVNYGVRPDGTYDFDRLPDSYRSKNHHEHYDFWAGRSVPDSWKKFRDIALYWIEFGVDGFRYDMAEMVPVEFWSYLNSAIKQKNAEAFLLAEVYNPKIYRDYIKLGLMDSLYDKVDFYDTLKLIMQGKAPTSLLTPIVDTFADIDPQMLHFLENHDEQRIASPDFAGDANKGKPAMVVSALIGKGPTLLYFAQDLGEKGEGDAGFGAPTRTTIFDYWGLETLKRWANNGKYDGGLLTSNEKSLNNFYQKLLSFSANSLALTGNYADLHSYNLVNTRNYGEKLYSFARWSDSERVIVVSNFSDDKSSRFEIEVMESLISEWDLRDGVYHLENIFDDRRFDLSVEGGVGKIKVSLGGLESLVLVF